MKRYLKKFSLASLAMVFLTGASFALAADTDSITIKLGMVDPDGSNYHKGALGIAEEVDKATNGRVKIQVLPGSQLGNERDMYEGAQMGTIEMFVSANAVMTNFIPEMVVLDQPFLFANADQAHRVIDGKLGALINQKTQAQGLRVVGWMESGFRNVFSSRPVANIGDFSGLKIRTMENKLHMAAFNALGAIATPMASGEVFTALQQKTIDAAENAIANVIANRYYEITKNITFTNHVFVFMGVIVSDKTWQRIPADLRDKFTAAVKAGCDRQRQMLVDANTAAEKELRGMGVKFFEIPPEQLAAKVAPAIQPFAASMSKEWIDAINADKGK
ncbi:ABC transporter substrate-binding protein [Betaproteobacteria bacterium]|nr:ABC transporter substrate-binding protein [Betaproteobacteria bacterium]